MWRDTLLYFLSAAILQNLVLHTGFGTSLLLRTARRGRDLTFFALLISLFSTATVLIAYPIDQWLGLGWSIKLLRPAIMVFITAVLYLLISVIFKYLFPRIYLRHAHLFPMAAFNNLVVAVALIINHQVSVRLLPALGLTLGACLGFLLLTVCMQACLDRTDHADIPKSFRGLPIAMLYLGILALAFMGFSSPYTF